MSYYSFYAKKMNKPYHIVYTATFDAGADLLDKRFVKIDTDKLAYATDAENSIGVLYLKAKSGETASVYICGIVLVDVGVGGVTQNTDVTSGIDGKAVAWTTGKIRHGIALDTVAEGGICPVLLR